jgi:hypothetical protein
VHDVASGEANISKHSVIEFKGPHCEPRFYFAGCRPDKAAYLVSSSVSFKEFVGPASDAETVRGRFCQNLLRTAVT